MKPLSYNDTMAWRRDPYRLARPQVMRLLEDITKAQAGLRKHGSIIDFRLAMSKITGDATGILNYIRACEAYPLKEDIL